MYNAQKTPLYMIVPIIWEEQIETYRITHESCDIIWAFVCCAIRYSLSIEWWQELWCPILVSILVSILVVPEIDVCIGMAVNLEVNLWCQSCCQSLPLILVLILKVGLRGQYRALGLGPLNTMHLPMLFSIGLWLRLLVIEASRC